MRTALLRLGRHSAPLHLLLIRARIPKLCSRPTLLLLPLRVAFRALGFDLLLPRSLPQSAFVLLPVICMVLLLFFFVALCEEFLQIWACGFVLIVFGFVPVVGSFVGFVDLVVGVLVLTLFGWVKIGDLSLLMVVRTWEGLW